MLWKLALDIDEPVQRISHQDKLLMIGSCFTENIGKYLNAHFFDVLVNPTGIVFDTLSIARHLKRIATKQLIEEKELSLFNELYFHWDFHTSFSSTSKESTLQEINNFISLAHQQLMEADVLFLTFGTSFSYFHKESDSFVSNCHKVPAPSFNKELIGIDKMYSVMENIISELRELNPKLRIVTTVSPVRHSKDGLVQNNRSKARLIELISLLEDKFDHVDYFPAYELQIDVLRDHRFYDVDLVHPNYAATEYIFSQFVESYLDDETQKLLPELKKVHLARNHRALHPETKAHQTFILKNNLLENELVRKYFWLSERF